MEPAKRATVLVLGDLGRSPRMLNHARSLVEHDWLVNLVGFSGARLPADIEGSPRVTVTHLADASPSGSTTGSTARLAWRGAALAVQVARALPPRTPAQIVFVQNPPGIPTLPIAWLQTRLTSSTLVVDWHNLTSAMLRLRVAPRHPLVGAAASMERWVGRRADVNLFVSATMGRRLEQDWGVRGTVFRDRPAAALEPLSAAERGDVRSRLLRDAGAGGDDRDWVIVLSPTSWTADEDFDLLVRALRRADEAIEHLPHGSRRARLLVLTSGRGALRERFERALSSPLLKHIVARTVWFEPADYPRAVASSDVGLCLHRSASGLDLPMKIMDFFGAGVPVLALDYGPCLAEAVSHGINGLLFRDDDELTPLLVRLTTSGVSMVDPLRAGALEAGSLRWGRSWTEIVLPLLADSLASPC